MSASASASDPASASSTKYKNTYIPFGLDEYNDRLVKVLRAMDEQSIDLLVSSRPENMYYLTNYQTAGDPFQIMIVSKSGTHIITRELEASNAEYRTHSSYSFYTEKHDPTWVAAEYISENYTVNTIGFEYNSSRMTHATQSNFEDALTTMFGLLGVFNNERVDVHGNVSKIGPIHIKFKDCSTLISELRVIKSKSEIELCRKAAGFAQATIDEALRNLEVGMTETEVAGIVTQKMYSLGSEYVAYPPFVSAGWTGCIGHYAAEQKPIEENDILFMEIGASCKRYHAARMHTVYIGEAPDWFVEAETLIRRAVDSARKAMKPGVLARDIDRIARSIISEFSQEYVQSERSGYSIGIGFCSDWAENDVLRFYPDSKTVLQENMIVHFIPWIKIPDKGAIGFSDTICITAEGGVSLFEKPSESTYQRIVRHEMGNTMPLAVRDDTNTIMGYIEANMDDAIKFHEPTKETKLVSRRFAGINNLYVKDESDRMGLMSFKIMGVSYAVHRLEQQGKLKPGSTITTMTDGNHGAAVSYVAQQRGLNSVIFVPRNMTMERMDRIKQYGATCCVVDGMYDDAIDMVKARALQNNWILISDTAWDGYEEVPKDISTGYCAIFDEAMRYLSENNKEYPTHIFLQAGVGGFTSAGVAYAVARMNPRPKLICVEPDDADCFLENVKQGCHEGTLMCKGKTDSIMSGLNCGLPSITAWPILRDYADLYIAIGDSWAREAVRALYHGSERVMAGESGAAGVAGLMACLDAPELKSALDLNDSSNVLVINTEGVTDKATFNKIIGYDVV